MTTIIGRHPTLLLWAFAAVAVAALYAGTFAIEALTGLADDTVSFTDAGRRHP